MTQKSDDQNHMHADIVATILQDHGVTKLHQTYQPNGWNAKELRNYKVGRLNKLFPNDAAIENYTLNSAMQDVLMRWHSLAKKPDHLKNLPYEDAIAKYMRIPRIDGKDIRKMAFDPRIRVDHNLAAEMDRLLGTTDKKFIYSAVRSNPDKPRPYHIMTLPFTLDPFLYKDKTLDHAALLRDVCTTWKTNTYELSRYLNFKKPMKDKIDFMMAFQEQPDIFAPETIPPEYNQPASVEDEYSYSLDDEDYLYENDFYAYNPKQKNTPKTDDVETSPFVLGGPLCDMLDQKIFSVVKGDGPFGRYISAANKNSAWNSLKYISIDKGDRTLARQPGKIFKEQHHPVKGQAVYLNPNPEREAFYQSLSEATHGRITEPEKLHKLSHLDRRICYGRSYTVKDSDALVTRGIYPLTSYIVKPSPDLDKTAEQFISSIAYFGEKTKGATDDDYIAYAELRKKYHFVGYQDYKEGFGDYMMNADGFARYRMDILTSQDASALEAKLPGSLADKKTAERFYIAKSYIQTWLENGELVKGATKGPRSQNAYYPEDCPS